MKFLLLPLAIGLVAGPCAAAPAKPYTRNVAIVIYENAEPLDWTGPFEVYNDAGSIGAANGQDAFNVYVVSKTTDPVNAQGLKVVPNYSIADAPKPDIVLFPGGPSSKIYEDAEFFAWAKQACAGAEIAQSVCTGAFVLGHAGLLAGKKATTHHDFHDQLKTQFPDVTLERGVRYVEGASNVATAGGLTSGIDLALHVVERYFGRDVAQRTATYMEYQGKGWLPA